MKSINDEEYFSELKMMFQSKGWHFLTNELAQNAEVINNLQVVKDERDLDFRRGQLAVIGFLLNLESSISHVENDDVSV